MTEEAQKLLWYTAFKCVLDHCDDNKERQDMFYDLLMDNWNGLWDSVRKEIMNEIKAKVKSDNNSKEMYQSEKGHWKHRDIWTQFYYIIKEM